MDEDKIKRYLDYKYSTYAEGVFLRRIFNQMSVTKAAKHLKIPRKTLQFIKDYLVEQGKL